jgi:hypothetical protein
LQSHESIQNQRGSNRPRHAGSEPANRLSASVHHYISNKEEVVIRRLLFALSIAAIVGATSGCAVNRATASLMPDADLSKLKSVYVVHQAADKNGVDQAIKDALTKRGLTATVGPAMTPPYPADAVITYVDKWMWDITMYLLELTVTVRAPVNEFPLATGNSLHTSLTRKSTKDMAEEVVTNIFTAKR